MPEQSCTRCLCATPRRRVVQFGECHHRLCEPCASFVEAALMGRAVWARGSEDYEHEAPIRNVEQFDRLLCAWYAAEGTLTERMRCSAKSMDAIRSIRDRFFIEMARWRLLAPSLADSWIEPHE